LDNDKMMSESLFSVTSNRIARSACLLGPLEDVALETEFGWEGEGVMNDFDPHYVLENQGEQGQCNRGAGGEKEGATALSKTAIHRQTKKRRFESNADCLTL